MKNTTKKLLKTISLSLFIPSILTLSSCNKVKDEYTKDGKLILNLRNLYFKETQNTFAQRIGVSKYTITSIESKRINCSKKTYAKIRKAIIDNETKRLIESEKECINFFNI